MKSIQYLILFATLCSPLVSRAAVTFNMAGATLYESDGTTPVPTTGLMLLVADTSGTNGFSSVAGGASLSLNSFLNGTDDLILAKWALGASSATPGFFSDAVSNLTLGANNWDAGDALALLWFPTLTTSSGTALAGDSYGIYYNSATSGASLDSGDAWITPASGTKSLNLLTTDYSGSHTSASTTASFTVSGVPEPSRALLAALGLGMVSLRRRRR
ncbi:MAG: PEP-CTERM sorting domain-containing protein [Prosthecobacter sp.]|uniref:PEP-CTERM sorting domain-containing protein n=1 Tax=Prosthecobacter sp. TaxID=1965333 RepID=UPI002630E51E|nr:PEP-CTERM sorting domain-containing protein [Prosthecobacter sp.]MCF7790208.1 PEP-CTERM sorting domain-containing protein [Prosthecobacter sp.]